MFDDDVIYVSLGVAPDLPLEAFLDGLLVGSTYVREAECHGVVAVRPTPKGMMKDVFS